MKYKSLSHTTWDCKYHVVHSEMSAQNVVSGATASSEVFRRLALQKESKVEEGHLTPDHVHLLLSILPKYAVSQVVGYVKGRAPSIWPGFMESENESSLGSTFGPEDSS